jgi:SPP1 family predicted phage head-tail adaptor
MSLPTIKAGDLKDRITLQSIEGEQSYTGSDESVDTWQDELDLWAQVRPLSVREQNEALHTVGVVSHRVTIRSLGVTVNTHKRFKFGDRYLNVVAALDWDEAQVFTQVFCLEQQ